MSDGISAVPKVERKGVALAIVSARAVCPLQMLSSIALQSWPTNTNFRISNVYGINTAEGRIYAVQDAIANKSKYIWFVDDDTVPPQDAGRRLMYLLEHNGPPYGKVMVAAGVYCTRGTPPEPLVYTGQGSGPDWNWKVGETFKRWGAGTGCMMINTEVFQHLPDPWFRWTQEADYRESDDLYFCAKLADAGFELMIHGGVLCHHYDMDHGIVYMLPRQSRPYVERVAEPSEPGLPMAPVTTDDVRISKAASIEGWMSLEELRWLAEKAKGCKQIAEVGSWMGRSTRALAENTDGQVYAIDTWKGSAEHHARLNGKTSEWLKSKFLENMGDLHNVHPFQHESLDASIRFTQQGALFEMVFIDADHEYESVKQDIKAWLPLVKAGGLLCGHDYHRPEVQRAVTELLPDHSLAPVEGSGIWYWGVQK